MLPPYRQLAARLLGHFPPPLTPATLTDYGIALSHEEVEQVAEELLALTLFWVHSALCVSLKQRDFDAIYAAVCQGMRDCWTDRYRLRDADVDVFFTAWPERQRTYQRLVQQGSTPVDIISEVVSWLQARGVIRPSDKQAVLVLFIDLVPVDEIGEVSAEIEAELG